MKNYKELSYKNLKNDKRNTIFSFVTMVLIIALLVSTIIVTKFKLENELEIVQRKEGNYNVRLLDITEEQVTKIEGSDNVEEFYLGKSLGTNIFRKVNEASGISRERYLDSDYSINELYAVDLKVFDEVFNYQLKYGRMPKDNSEVVVTTDILREYAIDGVDLSVGQVVSLDFEKNRTFDMYKTLNYFKSDLIHMEDYDRLRNDPNYTGFDGNYLNDQYGDLVKETSTLKVVGIIDVGEDNVLWHNKFFTVLNDDTTNQYTNFEAITKLKAGVSDEKIANEIGVNYIKYNRNKDLQNPAHGIGASNVRYPNYWKEDYDTSKIQNLVSVELIIVMILSFVLIFNSFTASIAFRTKSLGILTAIGATKKQVRKIIMREVFVTTIISIPFGLLLGIVQIQGLSIILKSLMDVDISNLSISINLIEIILILVLISVLVLGSILYSINRFFRYSPIEAMNNSSGVKTTKYKNKYGEVIDEDKQMEELLNYEKSTFKYKFMRKIFKLEGEIAYKNLTRNLLMNKNCRIAIMTTMLLGVIFFCQNNVNNLKVNYTVPSEEWNIQSSKGSNYYTESDIEKIEGIDGVKNVYREMVNTATIQVRDDKINDKLVTLIKNDDKWIKEGNDYLLTSRVRGVDNKSLDLYSKYLISGSLDGGIKNDEVILVSDWVNYKIIPSGAGAIDQIVTINNVLKYEVGEKINFTNEGIMTDLNNSESLKIKAIVSKDALREFERFSDISNCKEDLMVLVSQDSFSNKYGISNLNKLNISVDDADRDSVVERLENHTSKSGDSVLDLVKEKDEINKENNMIMCLNIMFVTSVAVLVIISLMATMIFNIFIRCRELAGLNAIGMNFKQTKKMIVCESFSLALQTTAVVLPISLALMILSVGSEFGRGGSNEMFMMFIVVIYILAIMGIVTIVGLIPIRVMKNKSISELLRD